MTCIIAIELGGGENNYCPASVIAQSPQLELSPKQVGIIEVPGLMLLKDFIFVKSIFRATRDELNATLYDAHTVPLELTAVN